MLREDFTSLPGSCRSGTNEYGADNVDLSGCGVANANGGNDNDNGRNIHITKAIVTFSPSVAADSLNVPSSLSGSMLTISSVPTTLMLGAPTTPAGRHSLSAATTPLANTTTISPSNTKHCSFALTPLIPPPPPPRQLSFLTTARFHTSAQGGPTSTATATTTTTAMTSMISANTRRTPSSTVSAPALIETVANWPSTPLTPLTPLTPGVHAPQIHGKHATLDARHSAVSQFTTLEDLDAIVVDETPSEMMRKLA